MSKVEYGYRNQSGNHEIFADTKVALVTAILGGSLFWTTLDDMQPDIVRALQDVQSGRGTLLPSHISCRHDVYHKVVKETI